MEKELKKEDPNIRPLNPYRVFQKKCLTELAKLDYLGIDIVVINPIAFVCSIKKKNPNILFTTSILKINKEINKRL